MDDYDVGDRETRREEDTRIRLEQGVDEMEGGRGEGLMKSVRARVGSRSGTEEAEEGKCKG